MSFIITELIVQIAKRIGIFLLLWGFYLCMQAMATDSADGNYLERVNNISPLGIRQVQTFFSFEGVNNSKIAELSVSGGIDLCPGQKDRHITLSMGRCADSSDLRYPEPLPDGDFSQGYTGLSEQGLCPGSAIIPNISKAEVIDKVYENDVVVIKLQKPHSSVNSNNLYNIAIQGGILDQAPDKDDADLIAGLAQKDLSVVNNHLSEAGNKFTLLPEIMPTWLYGADIDLSNQSTGVCQGDPARKVIPEDTYQLNRRCGTLANSMQDSNKIYGLFENSSVLSIPFIALYLEGSDSSTRRISEYDLPVDQEIRMEREGKLLIGSDESVPDWAKPVGGYKVIVQRSCKLAAGQGMHLFLVDTEKSNSMSEPNSLESLSSRALWHKEVTEMLDDNYANLTFRRGGDDPKLYNIIVNDQNTGVRVAPSRQITLYIYVEGRSESLGADAGHYTIKSLEFIPNSFWSKATAEVYEFVTKGLGEDFVRGVFGTWIAKTDLALFARIMLALYIAISGLFYALGLTQASQQEVMNDIVKITVVLVMTSSGAFDMFYKYVYPFFVHAGDKISVMIIQGDEEKIPQHMRAVGNKFAYLDKTLGFIFNPASIKKMLALLLDSPMGFIYAFILVEAIWDIFKGSMLGVIYYIQSLLFTIFLLCLAPLFCCFILFSQTRQIFDGWIRRLMMNMFIPLLYSISIVFLTDIVFVKLNDTFKFAVGERCLFKVPVIDSCLIKVPQMLGSSYELAGENEHDLSAEGTFAMSGLNLDFSDIFMLVLACKLFETFSHIPHDMAVSLFGGMPGMSFGFSSGSQNDVVSSITQTIGQEKDAVSRREDNKRAVVKRK